MRIALSSINPTVGDLDANGALVTAAARVARELGADLLVLPELCICGYPPKDLLLAEGFVDACERAADAAARAMPPGMTAIIGSPRAADAGITNSLLVYRDGERTAHYDKRLLPTYDVFDENRYFTPGRTPVVIEVGGVRVGLSICEDLWKGEDAGFASKYAGAPDPVAELASLGIDVLVSPSASPFVLGKGRRHREILASHARRHRIVVCSVNECGGNDELIFDGHAVAFDAGGALVAGAPAFQSAITLIEVGPGTAPPVTPATDPFLSESDDALLFRALVLGVRDYCRKTGFTKSIIGLSGGIDSAVTAAIAVAALGPSAVLGVAMPSAYSSDHSKSDAYLLATNLAMECITIPISSPVDAVRAVIDPAFTIRGLATLGATLPDLTEENLQSRIRGTLLMTLSNRTGAIVLTTGNKSEMAVGYCTLYGDMNGGLAVLSDVAKEHVYRLARHMNAHHAACGFAKPPIPEASITKPPSAELRPDQTDQDSLPPYDVLDEIIDRAVERRQSPARIAQETGFDAALVTRITRMIDLAEYKRKQAAIGLKVTSVAFGSGRRMPIAQRWRPGADVR
jgi:NAD+ synthase (glutamine-hydrolysing)